jgi:hypothetical protein
MLAPISLSLREGNGGATSQLAAGECALKVSHYKECGTIRNIHAGGKNSGRVEEKRQSCVPQTGSGNVGK